MVLDTSTLALRCRQGASTLSLSTPGSGSQCPLPGSWPLGGRGLGTPLTVHVQVDLDRNKWCNAPCDGENDPQIIDGSAYLEIIAASEPGGMFTRSTWIDRSPALEISYQPPGLS